MKSKNYILLQIKQILMDHKSYMEEKADKYIKEVENKTVYELLTLKKELSIEDEELRDVSCRASIWREEEY
jgi:hypothetical protein|tara:strand:- start:2775 stop:2987 length:213 start_codon:yes stop_codon:yes gene_type:complete